MKVSAQVSARGGLTPCLFMVRLTAVCALWALGAGAALANAPERHRINATPQVLVLNTPERGPAPSEMTPVPYAVSTVTLERTFLDGFSSFTPNTPPWRHHFDHGPYDKHWARTLSSNQEQQLNVDPGYAGSGPQPLGLNPFSVKGGVLQITGRAAPKAALPFLENYEYVSGMLSSAGSFEQKYGFFEARLRVPGGQGVWPAFWLKRDARYAPEGGPSWPPEIDVMEHIGAAASYHVTTHWDLAPNNQRSGLELDVEAPTQRFHNYGVLWDQERTVFYLDRQPVAQIETKPNHHVAMFILINMALGGRWPGPVDPGDLPATFEIDWVAAWQFSDK